ncbi:MAG TPA: CinA family nicotinamide mononucleotide deamidase-related protein [Dehalococcoidia bacterium]|nr:CinA family nicotinamide mononucleotide deamidase-related protein [Dehalococcoidia bacterium]
MRNLYRAEIVSVGTELLRGEITDTNAGYLASEMPFLGIELYRMTTAADDREQLCQVLQQALDRSDLVITSGGLGPTEDDLTRDCIASVVGEEPSVDPELEKHLRDMFRRMGREMPVHNIRQAVLIPSAESLPNPRGTAPGWYVRKNNTIIAALPGPPRELMPMWRNEVVPRLKTHLPGEEILSRTVKTFTIAEAKVSELVQPIFKAGNPEVGIYSKSDGIHVRLIAHGDSAEQVLDTTEAKLREMFTPFVWGKDDDTLGEVVCGWLAGRKLGLSIMEDGTGGQLANSITESESCSACFRGGLIASTAGIKVACGVPAEIVEQHGAISAEVAEAMAVAARERFSSDIGLSTTGIAEVNNPGGKQPGLAFIGIADHKGTRSWQQNYPPSRIDARSRGAIAALFRLRERLIELGLAAV